MKYVHIIFIMSFYDILRSHSMFVKFDIIKDSSFHDSNQKNVRGSDVRQKKKICVFTVRRPSLIFGPDPKLFYGTFSRKLFKYPIFAFQCSFCCLMDHYVDKNKLNVTLQV